MGSIEVESFQNDITSFHSADDVITLLIHMGYLAYDNKTSEVFIPNEEVKSVFLRAVKNDGWEEVVKVIFCLWESTLLFHISFKSC